MTEEVKGPHGQVLGTKDRGHGTRYKHKRRDEGEGEGNGEQRTASGWRVDTHGTKENGSL